jgi:hypothetical protein
MDNERTKQAYVKAVMEFRRAARELAEADHKLAKAERAYFAKHKTRRTPLLVGSASDV